MRIISGTLKGRNILVPKNFNGRPTTDFGREGLFNVLNNLVDFDQIHVLELFAGTGAFSIECFSRGAEYLKSVEKDPLHARFIRDNFRSFEMTHADVVLADVMKFLGQESQQYDLIFADPPFDLPSLELLPGLVLGRNLLKSEGVFVLEHGKRNNFEQEKGFLQERRYSNVHFSFFEKPEDK
jgi:16S rRNA (guanine966-N2)-methyltransferase